MVWGGVGWWSSLKCQSGVLGLITSTLPYFYVVVAIVVITIIIVSLCFIVFYALGTRLGQDRI